MARVVVGPGARRQIAAAVRWWKENRGAAQLITDEIDWITGLLELNPHIGQTTENARRPGLRRFYLERIDYHLYYRVDAQRAQVTVTAFRHARRRPVRI